MKLVLISDTHNNHESLEIPPCDLLIHAGDWSRHGTEEETLRFLEWFGRQPARARVLTPGNHDFFAETHQAFARQFAHDHGALWLGGEGARVLGLRVWASPYTPRHGTWAYQDDRGAPLAARWAPIPQDLDILITHGPPHGVLDRTWRGEHVGCEALLDAVRQKRPRAHVFGHVHECHGETTLEGLPTRFLNAASSVSLRTRNPTTNEVYPPLLLDLEPAG